MNRETDEHESDDGLTDNEKWAYIFNTLGKPQVREMLFDAAYSLKEGDAEEKVYSIEQTNADFNAFDITDHVHELERIVNETNTPDLPNDS